MEETKETKPTCSVAGCDRPTLAHGLCATHCKRVERHGDPQADLPIATHGDGNQICLTPGCGKPTSIQRETYTERGARGYCRSCYRTIQNQNRRKAATPRREYVFA